MSASSAWTIWCSPIGLPNWTALRCVAGRHVERPLGDPDGLGGDPGARPLERPHREANPSPSAPIRLAAGTRTAVEQELRGGRAADPHLVLERGRRRSRACLVSTTKQDRFRCRLPVGIGHGEDGDEVGDAALADEPLRAVDARSRRRRGRRASRSPPASEPAPASVRAKAMSLRPRPGRAASGPSARRCRPAGSAAPRARGRRGSGRSWRRPRSAPRSRGRS